MRKIIILLILYNTFIIINAQKSSYLWHSAFIFNKNQYDSLDPSLSFGVDQINKGFITCNLNYGWWGRFYDILGIETSVEYNPWFNVGGFGVTHRYGWTFINGGIKHRYLSDFSGQSTYVFSPQIFLGMEGRGIGLNYNMITNRYYKTIINPVSIDLIWGFTLRTKEAREIHRKIRKTGSAIILEPKKE